MKFLLMIWIIYEYKIKIIIVSILCEIVLIIKNNILFVNMVIDKIKLSFCKFDDDIFCEKEFLNIKEENLMEEINLFSGDFLSCFLSVEELKYCIEILYIKDNFIDIKNIGVGGFGLLYEVVYRIEDRKYVFKFVKCVFFDLDNCEVKILVLFNYFNVFRYYIFWMILFYEWNFFLKGFWNENFGFVFFRKEIFFFEDNFVMGSIKFRLSRGKSLKEFYDVCLVI